MLEFKKITLGEIERIKAYFPYSRNRVCDNTVGGNFMWRDFFSTEFTEFNDTVIFKARIQYNGNITAFMPPLGRDYQGSLKQIAEYCRYHDLEIVFFSATDEDVSLLQKEYPKIDVCRDDNWCDYLYNAEDLLLLAGRKYSGQRNHINSFRKSYPGYVFEEINTGNIADVIEFNHRFSSALNKDSVIFHEENSKTIEVLENYDLYGMLGGLLRVNGAVIAYSLGEVYNDVLFVHVEKADMSIRGAYQVINNEFAKHFCCDGVKFINREEDVGDEGLRTSKRSYHPCRIIDKYTVVCYL